MHMFEFSAQNSCSSIDISECFAEWTAAQWGPHSSDWGGQCAGYELRTGGRGAASVGTGGSPDRGSTGQRTLPLPHPSRPRRPHPPVG